MADAGIATLAGMERSAEFLDRVAVSPPAGAVADKYATHEAVSSGMRAEGVQLNDEIVYTAVAVIVTVAVLVTPFADAWITAVAGKVEVDVLTVKEAEVRVQGMVTVAGNVNPVAVLEIATLNPARGAAALMVTRQVV